MLLVSTLQSLLCSHQSGHSGSHLTPAHPTAPAAGSPAQERASRGAQSAQGVSSSVTHPASTCQHALHLPAAGLQQPLLRPPCSRSEEASKAHRPATAHSHPWVTKPAQQPPLPNRVARQQPPPPTWSVKSRSTRLSRRLSRDSGRPAAATARSSAGRVPRGRRRAGDEPELAPPVAVPSVASSAASSSPPSCICQCANPRQYEARQRSVVLGGGSRQLRVAARIPRHVGAAAGRPPAWHAAHIAPAGPGKRAGRPHRELRQLPRVFMEGKGPEARGHRQHAQDGLRGRAGGGWEGSSACGGHGAPPSALHVASQTLHRISR